MTGSESPNSSARKGNIRPNNSLYQQQQQKETKADTPTDQLRRLAIKNSYGTKSITSPLMKSLSSSTSSLHLLCDSAPLNTPASTGRDNAAGDIADCKPQLTLTSTENQQHENNGKKSSPYITRQELLHSLRRTSSNLCVVGMTQTICSGGSSYIYHTPRHLTRTRYNPKSAIMRSATITPDSGLQSYQLAFQEKQSEVDGQETQSLVNLPRPSLITDEAIRRRSQRASRHVEAGVAEERHYQIHLEGDRNNKTHDQETAPSSTGSDHGSDTGGSSPSSPAHSLLASGHDGGLPGSGHDGGLPASGHDGDRPGSGHDGDLPGSGHDGDLPGSGHDGDLPGSGHGVYNVTRAPNNFTEGHPNHLTPGHPNRLTAGHPNHLTPGHPNHLTPGHPNRLTAGHPNHLTPGHPNHLIPGQHGKSHQNRVPGGVGARRVVMRTDKKIKLHIPQGKKTATLV